MTLYSNPQGLYEFQARLTAYSVLRPGNLLVADPGLGKTHIGLATAAILMEDGAVDHAIFIVEGNKVDEWIDDFEDFTEFEVNKFHGPKRALDLDKRITLSTYHTFRDALVTVDKADSRKLGPGPAMETFSGRRVLVVCDEAAILGTSRTSRVYQAFEKAFREWRKAGEVRILAMTATPMQSSPENFFNLGRIIQPDLMMTVQEFNDWYVTDWNDWGKPKRFKNLEHLEQTMAPIMLRKRKTDPDVIEQFPETVEKFVSVRLDKATMRAYNHLDSWIKGLPENEQLPGFNVLNAFVQHPHTVFTSGWEPLSEWVVEFGEEKLRKLPATKAERIIGWATEVHESEDSAGGHIIFSRSNNALVHLAEEIDGAFPFVEFHGRRTDAQNRAAKAAFRAGEASIMLASGKAERGINLPEAHYITMFDAPVSHASYMQRLSRGSRIGSNVGGTLTVKTFIGRDTIERATVNLWNRRNEWSDTMQDAHVDPEDDEFISAATRRALINQAHKEG
jgi:superfamily II DNA or RNA helicase